MRRKSRRKRKEWDGTVSDLSKYRLNKKQLLRKKKMMESKHNMLQNPHPASSHHDSYYQKPRKVKKRKRKSRRRESDSQENPPFPEYPFREEKQLSTSTQRIGQEERKLTALQREYELIQQQIEDLEDDHLQSSEFKVISKKPKNDENISSLMKIKKNNYFGDNLMDEPTIQLQSQVERKPLQTASLSPQVLKQMDDLTTSQGYVAQTPPKVEVRNPEPRIIESSVDGKKELLWEKRLFEMEKKLFESEKRRGELESEFNKFRRTMTDQVSNLKEEIFELKKQQERSRFMKSTDHVGELSILKGEMSPKKSRIRKSPSTNTHSIPKPSIEYDTRGSRDQVIIDDDVDDLTSQDSDDEEDDDDDMPIPFDDKILPQPQPIVLGPESGKDHLMNISKTSKTTRIIGRKMKNERSVYVVDKK